MKDCCPDGMPTEIFKELVISIYAMQNSLEPMECWCSNESIGEEDLKVRVVLIFKKGVANELGNYRPMSLLNTTLKLFAAVWENRIEAEAEQVLHETHYGFRRI